MIIFLVYSNKKNKILTIKGKIDIKCKPTIQKTIKHKKPTL